MARLQGRIVINPKVLTDNRDALAIAYNEAYRMVMEANNFDPMAEPTEEQKQFFADTAYANDPLQLKRTITARIATYDDSVPNPTPEQYQDVVSMLEMVQQAGVIQNQEEEDVVSSTLEDMTEKAGQMEQLQPMGEEAMPAEPMAAPAEQGAVPMEPGAMPAEQGAMPMEQGAEGPMPPGVDPAMLQQLMGSEQLMAQAADKGGRLGTNGNPMDDLLHPFRAMEREAAADQGIIEGATEVLNRAADTITSQRAEINEKNTEIAQQKAEISSLNNKYDAAKAGQDQMAREAAGIIDQRNDAVRQQHEMGQAAVNETADVARGVIKEKNERIQSNAKTFSGELDKHDQVLTNIENDITGFEGQIAVNKADQYRQDAEAAELQQQVNNTEAWSGTRRDVLKSREAQNKQDAADLQALSEESAAAKAAYEDTMRNAASKEERDAAREQYKSTLAEIKQKRQALADGRKARADADQETLDSIDKAHGKQGVVTARINDINAPETTAGQTGRQEPLVDKETIQKEADANVGAYLEGLKEQMRKEKNLTGYMKANSMLERFNKQSQQTAGQAGEQATQQGGSQPTAVASGTSGSTAQANNTDQKMDFAGALGRMNAQSVGAQSYTDANGNQRSSYAPVEGLDAARAIRQSNNSASGRILRMADMAQKNGGVDYIVGRINDAKTGSAVKKNIEKQLAQFDNLRESYERGGLIQYDESGNVVNAPDGWRERIAAANMLRGALNKQSSVAEGKGDKPGQESDVKTQKSINGPLPLDGGPTIKNANVAEQSSAISLLQPGQPSNENKGTSSKSEQYAIPKIGGAGDRFINYNSVELGKEDIRNAASQGRKERLSVVKDSLTNLHSSLSNKELTTEKFNQDKEKILKQAADDIIDENFTELSNKFIDGVRLGDISISEDLIAGLVKNLGIEENGDRDGLIKSIREKLKDRINADSRLSARMKDARTIASENDPRYIEGVRVEDVKIEYPNRFSPPGSTLTGTLGGMPQGGSPLHYRATDVKPGQFTKDAEDAVKNTVDFITRHL